MRYREYSVSFMPPLTRMVKTLLSVTSVSFLLTYLPAALFHFDLPYLLFGLTPYSVTHHLTVWQLATYLFLHGGWFHIIFNLFALWMFGVELEQTWGPQRFLFYFFLTGIGAGLFNVVLEPSSTVMTIGNSGAVYGILLAYGMLFPNRPIFLWFVIPLKAKWFVLGIGVIEFYSSLTQPGSGIAHVAHLGGMLFGFLYLYFTRRGLQHELGARYDDWRRDRLRREFEDYRRRQEKRERKDRNTWLQ